MIINQLANPLRTQLSPKLPFTVEICRNCPFMHIDVISCVVVVYPIQFHSWILWVDNSVATMLAPVMLQANRNFFIQVIHKILCRFRPIKQEKTNKLKFIVVQTTLQKTVLYLVALMTYHSLGKMVWNCCLAILMKLSSRISSLIVSTPCWSSNSLRENVCTTKRQRFDIGERAVNFILHLQEIGRRLPGVVKELILREQFQKHNHFALKRQTS